MADDYQDIVELGIEGVGHLTDKYHDTVYGYAGKHKPHLPHWHKKHKEDVPPPPRDPPPRHSQDRSPNQRNRSGPRRDRYDSDSDSDSGRKDWEDRRMYGANAPERRRDSGYRDEGGYERTEEEREYYGYSPRTSQQMVVRDRDPQRSSGALVARPPSPPPYGYPDGYYGDAWAARGRPMPSRQRSSSWSPPRRSDQRSHHSPPRRVRSKSPNHHRVVATIVGALAGGVAGSRYKPGEELPNKVSTVAGALIGGLGAREMEKVYDRHKEKRYQEEEREEERRERRREKRERRYS